MKPLAITLGDPAGIGSEVVAGALRAIGRSHRLWLFGEWEYFAKTPGVESILASFRRVSELPAEATDGENLFVDVALSRARPLRFGAVDPLYGSIALSSVLSAIEAINRGLCIAMVTAPINKQAIRAAGSEFPGHTELLASKAGLHRYAFDYAMYFDSTKLRVALLSVHLPLRQALSEVRAEKISGLAALVSREFQRLHGFVPRLAAAGINPHAGEDGLFGDEDKIVAEGVRAAAGAGLTITGPHPADTVFRSATNGEYDVVLAMYHDQGLIPVKSLAFESSVNVTLGLPYLRCSVDHGTAFDIAGKGLADPRPMRHAIEWAARFAPRVSA